MTRTVIVLAALAVTVALAGTPVFTICGTGTLLNAQVTTPDAVWNAGSTVSFVISGDLSAPIESGATVYSLAKFSGAKVEDKTEDLCTYDGTPFSCPEAAGHHSWTFPLAIPEVPFSGKLTVHNDLTNADGSSILCLDLAVQL